MGQQPLSVCAKTSHQRSQQMQLFPSSFHPFLILPVFFFSFLVLPFFFLPPFSLLLLLLNLLTFFPSPSSIPCSLLVPFQHLLSALFLHHFSSTFFLLPSSTSLLLPSFLTFSSCLIFSSPASLPTHSIYPHPSLKFNVQASLSLLPHFSPLALSSSSHSSLFSSSFLSPPPPLWW